MLSTRRIQAILQEQSAQWSYVQQLHATWTVVEGTSKTKAPQVCEKHQSSFHKQNACLHSISGEDTPAEH